MASPSWPPNLRGNLDPASAADELHRAFSRPGCAADVPTRLWLWQAHVARLGALDGADPLDLERPAVPVEMPGGDVRKFVPAAGYDASAAVELPGMRHLLAATVSEYQKLGRRVPADRFL